MLLTMISKLGMHWIRTHPEGRDLPHIERMQYRSVKLFEWHWNNRDACGELLSVLPKDSYILARDHPMSEQKQDMWNDPVGTGTRHANEWAMKVAGGNVHTPVERTFFLGINEPDATSGDRNKIDLYTEAFLRRLKVHGLRGGAFNFSTGHPRTVDGTGNTQADYTVFERSHQAIVDGKHIGVLHIYGTASTPCAPGHYDRLWTCPWNDVEWVVGECGADEHVIGGGAHDGYLISMNHDPDLYCQWLDKLILGVSDKRIHSYQVFTYDFSHPWASFDIRPIRDALEAHIWQHMSVTPTHPESVSPIPGTTMYVIAENGLNLRDKPVTGNVLAVVPYGAPVLVMDHNDDAVWTMARYNNVTGWMHLDYLSETKPKEEDHTVHIPIVGTGGKPESADNWNRAIDWVLTWEGGYQNHHDDKGNWTGCEVGKGQNKGTKYGISACSYPYLDIPKLTIEQAKDIYYTDYWVKSGANQLPWPMSLLVLDTAVLHGVGTAQSWLKETGPNPYEFAAKRLRVYTKLSNWDHFGKAWINRTADLLTEMG